MSDSKDESDVAIVRKAKGQEIDSGRHETPERQDDKALTARARRGPSSRESSTVRRSSAIADALAYRCAGDFATAR